MEPRVLNLSAFGEVINNPKDKQDRELPQEPQKALPPADVDDFKYVDSPEKDFDFKSVVRGDKKSVVGVVKKSEDGETKYGKLVSKLLQNIIQTKLLHWQCLLYGQHKALDELFGSLIDNGDTLVEAVMGKYGRPTLVGDDLNIKIYNFENPKDGDLTEFMDHLYQCYRVDCRSHFDEEKDSEIVNIIDEIIASIDQTKYLISLR
jgi:DNA-binding ferritin-like protein